MQNRNCFIEFDIEREQNFTDLKHVFDLLKEAKNNRQPKPDEFWLDNFPDYSLKHFYFTESDKKPTFQTADLKEFTWHFYSLTTLLDTDYEIEYSDCFKLTDNTGRLEYLPYSYPYGGITGLIVFISSFNCKPTIIDDGTSLYKINFMPNGDFSIIDLNDPLRQDSSVKRFHAVDLLKKFAMRFK
ncbi:MAG: hypothetical protein ACOVSR_05655 [Bacteroidia bacterium]